MLTLKQKQTFEFIQAYISEHDIAPTEAEIAMGIGIKSRGVVHRYVTALASAGYIEIVPGKRRNIRLLREDETTLPVLGKIAAGSPLEAVDPNMRFDVVEQLIGPKRFLLIVKGDSMIGDNICDGDYIICEQCDSINVRDIAVVLVAGQEATLKRVRKNANDTVTLIPSNPAMNEMIYPANQVEIQGIYLGLLRM